MNETPLHGRWTPDRLAATAWYGLVGAVDSAILTSACTGLLYGAGLATASAEFGLVVLCLAGVGIVLLAAHHASKGTCTKHPAAPLGIAIGFGVGGMFGVTILTSGAGHDLQWLLGLVGAAVSCGLGLLAYKGGMKGLFAALGRAGVGVGNLCATCAYDLSGTPEGWPCPECGGNLRFTKPESAPADQSAGGAL